MDSSKVIPILYKRPVYEDALERHARIREERATGHVVQLRKSHVPRPIKKKEITPADKHFKTTDSKQ